MARIIEAFKQFFDGEGEPLSGGFLKFTVSGTNATDKNTYADAEQTVENTNPVELDSEGRAPNIFGAGVYRVTLYDVNLQQIDQKDPISNDKISTGVSAWSSTIVYNVPDIVIGSDLDFYRSLVSFNENNDPTISPEEWEHVDFLSFYNPNKTYAEFARCVDTDTGIEYISLVDNNLGNDPASSPTKWEGEDAASTENAAAIAVNAGDIATNATDIGINASDITTVDDKYKPTNTELLLINDGTTVGAGAAFIGAEYQDSQYYGNLAVGAQYYGNEAVGDQYYGRLADGDQFYGGTAAGAQYYGSNAIGAQYYGKDATGDQFYGNLAIGAQYYGLLSIGDQFYGVSAAGDQYYGEGATGGQFYGLNATGAQTYGQAASGNTTIGTGATGGIDIGSAVGTPSTRRLIEGANSATFEEIIAVAVPGAWTIITPTTGWFNVVGDEVQYRLINNGTRMEVKGSVTYSSGALNIYTAPAAFRPLVDRLSTIVRFGAAQTSEPMRFSAAGAVTAIVATTNGDVISFNNIIPLD